MSVEPQQIGSYRLLQRLGHGSVGEVYLVIDMRTNQQNALKLLRAGATTSAQEVRFFEGEAKTISQFNHPHILPLLDYGETTLDGAQIPYVVTPFCPDGTLVTWLRQNSNIGIVPPQDVAAIIQQGAEALQYAHNYGIVHQDVKPSNFFIRSKTAGVPDLLVGDFGLAQITRDEGNAHQAVRGTPTYIAPEQWTGQPVPATDQYALAVMAYQMLTGQSPFQGSREQLRNAHLNLWPAPPSTLHSSLSPDVDGVILRALAKRPGERFSSIMAFADALQQVLPAPAAAQPLQGQVVLPFAGALNNDPVPFYNDETVAGNAVRPAQPAQPPVQPAPQFVPQRDDIPPLPPPIQPSPPNEPSRRSTNTTIIVLIIALIAVLLIGGVVLFSVLHSSTGTLSPSAATATALTNATATAQVDGQTATAGAGNATATATAQGAQNAATATAQAAGTNATATAQTNAHATATAQAGSRATATAATATATTLSQFNGNWVNDDSAQTKGVSRLNITNNSTTISVQAFGCGTSDCLWGTQSTPYTGTQFTVTFTSNTGSIEQLVISLNNPQQLKVIDLSSTNGSTTYTFHRT